MTNNLEGLKIPSHWKILQLQDVCHKITDGTHKTPNYRDSGVRFISIKNIRPYQPINWDRYEKFIDPKQHEELVKRCRPEFDDILFPRIGTLGFAKRIDFKEEVSLFVGLGLLKPKKDMILPKYLEYWMNHPYIYKLSHERATGSGRLTLPLEQSRVFPVPLAPFMEQALIVSEIEKQFSRLDEAIATLKRVKANLKRYKAAVLKAAVEGKLTEDWRKQHPNAEPASKLLERILAERRVKWSGRGKYEEPSALETRDVPSLPKGWVWATVEQLSVLVQYGSSAKTHEEVVGIPVLRMGNIEDARLRVDSLKYLPKNHDEFPGLFLQVGDILFNRTNSAELVGKTAVYMGKPDPCSFASYLIRVRLVQGCAPDILAYFINSVFGRAWIAQVVSQQVGQANVNGTKLQALTVPLPPLDEQGQIVAEVERRLSVIEELEAAVQANLTRAERLRQAILSQAFNGKLLCNGTRG